jgi:hypothetical protein
LRSNEGRLKTSWTHLITPSRKFVEVRWQSLFRSTSLGRRCTSYNGPPTSRKRMKITPLLRYPPLLQLDVTVTASLRITAAHWRQSTKLSNGPRISRSSSKFIILRKIWNWVWWYSRTLLISVRKYGVQFEFQSDYRFSLLKMFMIFLNAAGTILRYHLEIDHNHLLPNLYLFTIYIRLPSQSYGM